MPKPKIFLSHKGADKPRVRDFAATLEAVGLSPWLDEQELAAGRQLERGLLGGFKESCAAVFFVTPAFKDEGYPAAEINYAISEKRTRGDQFALIALVFADGEGPTPEVPELLRPYVWKEPRSDLEAFREILRALPAGVASHLQIDPSLPAQAPPRGSEFRKPHPSLDHEAEKVLQAIGEAHNSVDAHYVARLAELSVHKTQYHIDRLGELKLISSVYQLGGPTSYYVTKGGRAYLIESDLLK